MKIETKYILTGMKEGEPELTIDESAKEDFKKLMNWSNEDFEKRTRVLTKEIPEKIEEVKDDFMKDKKERDFSLIDPANVMLMGKIQGIDEYSSKKDKRIHLMFDFISDNSDIEVTKRIDEDEEVFIVWKGKARWGKYSIEYYKRALEVAKAWKTDKLEFYVQDKKNSPLLMACDELGFVLAPRIDSEDLE